MTFTSNQSKLFYPTSKETIWKHLKLLIWNLNLDF